MIVLLLKRMRDTGELLARLSMALNQLFCVAAGMCDVWSKMARGLKGIAELALGQCLCPGDKADNGEGGEWQDSGAGPCALFLRGCHTCF